MYKNRQKQQGHVLDDEIKPLPSKIGNGGELLLDYDTFFNENKKYYKRESSDSSNGFKKGIFGKMN